MDMDEVISLISSSVFRTSALFIVYIFQKQMKSILLFSMNWCLMLLQVECIMAILIYKNLVKGYFAHKSKVVVLSKQEPFPKLNGKPVNS